MSHCTWPLTYSFWLTFIGFANFTSFTFNY
jgi:hypothetical protein